MTTADDVERARREAARKSTPLYRRCQCFGSSYRTHSTEDCRYYKAQQKACEKAAKAVKR